MWMLVRVKLVKNLSRFKKYPMSGEIDIDKKLLVTEI